MSRYEVSDFKTLNLDPKSFFIAYFLLLLGYKKPKEDYMHLTGPRPINEVIRVSLQK